MVAFGFFGKQQSPWMILCHSVNASWVVGPPKSYLLWSNSYEFFACTQQWQIQNFPEGVTNLWAWTKKLLFDKLLAENCMKMKEISSDPLPPIHQCSEAAGMPKHLPRTSLQHLVKPCEIQLSTRPVRDRVEVKRTILLPHASWLQIIILIFC